MTLDEGLIRTWRFPRFSALYIFFSASFNTLILTMSSKTISATKNRSHSGGEYQKEVGDDESKKVEKGEMEPGGSMAAGGGEKP